MSRFKFIQAVSALDARTDRNIRNYFVPTKTLDLAVSASEQSFALIGLKGAGKTTLYRALVENWRGETDCTTVGLSTSDALFDSYIEKLNCLQFEQSVKQGMLLFVLRNIDEHINKFPKPANFADWVIRKDKALKATTAAGKLLKRFQGLSIMGCGLTLRPGDKIESFDPLPARESAQLVALLKEFGQSGHRLRIVLDDPDRLFSRGSIFDPHLLAGYILGANAVAQELGFVQFVHILKSSVYDTLRDVEEMANLPYDYFRYISWTPAELREIISSRLHFSGAAPGDIFDDTDAFHLTEFVARIRNGPRDLLRYLEIILKSGGNEVVSSASIAGNESAFKAEARRQMESVYAGIYEGVELFMEAVFSARADLSVPEFEVEFQKLRLASEPRGVDYSQPWLRRADKALRALLDSGSIDVKMHGTWIHPFEAEYFRFKAKDSRTTIRPNAVFT